MTQIEEDLQNDLIKNQDDRTELARVVDTLLNNKFRRRKTRLRSRTIPTLTTLDAIAGRYDINLLKNWVIAYTENLTSIDGKGRQEIVDITKYTIDRQAKRDKMMIDAFGKK